MPDARQAPQAGEQALQEQPPASPEDEMQPGQELPAELQGQPQVRGDRLPVSAPELPEPLSASGGSIPAERPRCDHTPAESTHKDRIHPER